MTDELKYNKAPSIWKKLKTWILNEFVRKCGDHSMLEVTVDVLFWMNRICTFLFSSFILSDLLLPYQCLNKLKIWIMFSSLQTPAMFTIKWLSLDLCLPVIINNVLLIKSPHNHQRAIYIQMPSTPFVLPDLIELSSNCNSSST